MALHLVMTDSCSCVCCCVSKCACRLHQDLLADKRVLPGHSPRLPNKVWSERQKVTERSCVVWVGHIHKAAEHTPKSLRKKLDKVHAEELAMWAAFVVNVAKEVQMLVPLSDELLQSEWIDKFIASDPMVLTAVPWQIFE